MRFLCGVSISALLAACFPNAEAQAPTYSILHVELEKVTLYVHGYCAPADQAQNPNKLPRPALNALTTAVGIGDIVSVNGQQVKGTAIEIITLGSLSPNSSPVKFAIGDFQAIPNACWDLGFQNPDGTSIGSLHIDGAGGSPRPPDAPKEITGGSYTVTGGTGAFFGARGYFQPVQDPVSGERQTTDCEDPAYRRINADPGGNKRHPVLYLVPLSQPQIIATPNGPAVVHSSDGSLVTAAKPAKAGEVLTLYASGLGPTRPGVDPGQPFPANPPQAVNSPVQVLVNGAPNDVLYTGGYPGAVDGTRSTSPSPAARAPSFPSVDQRMDQRPSGEDSSSMKREAVG